jgi:hypothetical protein
MSSALFAIQIITGNTVHRLVEQCIGFGMQVFSLIPETKTNEVCLMAVGKADNP